MKRIKVEWFHVYAHFGFILMTVAKVGKDVHVQRNDVEYDMLYSATYDWLVVHCKAYGMTIVPFATDYIDPANGVTL